MIMCNSSTNETHTHTQLLWLWAVVLNLWFLSLLKFFSLDVFRLCDFTSCL